MGRARPRDAGRASPGPPAGSSGGRDPPSHPGRGGGPDRPGRVRRHPDRAHRGTRRGPQGPALLLLPQEDGPAALPAGRAAAVAPAVRERGRRAARRHRRVPDPAGAQAHPAPVPVAGAGQHPVPGGRDASRGRAPPARHARGPGGADRTRARGGRVGPAQPAATSRGGRHLRRGPPARRQHPAGTAASVRT